MEECECGVGLSERVLRVLHSASARSFLVDALELQRPSTTIPTVCSTIQAIAATLCEEGEETATASDILAETSSCTHVEEVVRVAVDAGTGTQQRVGGLAVPCPCAQTEFARALEDVLHAQDEGGEYKRPPGDTVRRFIRGVLDAAERANVGASDALLALYFDLLHAARDDGAVWKRVYPRASKLVCGPGSHALTAKPILLRIEREFNQVGMTDWPAGAFLCELIAARADLFSSRRVLELGAGVGLTAVFLSRCVPDCSIVATDYGSLVVANLRANVRANDAANVQVEELDWNDCAGTQRLGVFDVAFAADCIYDPHDHAALAACLRRIGAPLTLLASSVRSEETLDLFISECARQDLAVTDVTSVFLPSGMRGVVSGAWRSVSGRGGHRMALLRVSPRDATESP